jgi:hypothetical protein
MTMVIGKRERHPRRARRIATRSWFALGFCWSAFCYLWILPLLVPTGAYPWGHYRLANLLLGVPLGFATLWLTAVALSPPRVRRDMGLRLASVLLSLLFAVPVSDVVYVLCIRMSWRPNVWRDDVGIDLRYNQLDSQLGWKRKPQIRFPQDNVEIGPGDPRQYARNFYYWTDEIGFRNPTGIHHADIVFLGDSFTNAPDTKAADTFVQRVAARSGLTAVNLGVGGYGPQQEFITLQRYGLAYKPRFVVWQIFGGNDLRDAERFPGWIVHPDQSQKTSLRSRYMRDSPVFQLLDRTLLPERVGSAQATLQQSDGGSIPLSVLGVYAPDLPARYPLGWAETKRVIEAGERLCRSRGIKLAVLFVPTREQVLARYIQFHSEKARQRSLPGGVWQDPRDFGSRLGEFCRRIGCSFIDALPALQQRATQDNRYLYFPANHHLDIDGHDVVARLVRDWVERASRRAAALRRR